MNKIRTMIANALFSAAVRIHPPYEYEGFTLSEILSRSADADEGKIRPPVHSLRYDCKGNLYDESAEKIGDAEEK